MKKLNEDKSWGVEKYSKFLNESNEEAFGDKIDPAWEEEENKKNNFLKRLKRLSRVYNDFANKSEYMTTAWFIDEVTEEDMEALEEIANKMSKLFPDLKSISEQKDIKEDKDNQKTYQDKLNDAYKHVIDAKKEFVKVIPMAAYEFTGDDNVNYGNVGSLNHIAEIIEEATNRIAVHARIPGYKDE